MPRLLHKTDTTLETYVTESGSSKQLPCGEDIPRAITALSTGRYAPKAVVRRFELRCFFITFPIGTLGDELGGQTPYASRKPVTI
ncbi:MAG: hypothetical protein JWN70_5295 [Planctomycetaceae bacterium]|nr:hypothetical protein [Planctomycetaceae bacterium]